MFRSVRAAARRQRNCHRRCIYESLEDRLALSATLPKVMDVSVASSQWAPAFYSYLDEHSLGDSGYSIPVGSNSQSAALPWNNLDQIRVTFSEDVFVDSADLALTGKNVTSYSVSDFSYDPQTRAAVWTLSTPLQKDRLMIDLDADGIDPITDVDGNILDGEWTNNSDTYASGNGSAGGDFEFTLNVLPGDANSSGQVTTSDYLQVKSLDGKTTSSTGYLAKYDIDGSGTISSADWQYVLGRVGNALPIGTPAGVANDAPTAERITGVTVSNTAIDRVIELWDYFADYENGANGLAFSIQSNSDPSLFESLTINSSTGEMTINALNGASGRSDVTVLARDANGVATSLTFSIDVDYENCLPYLQLGVPEQLIGNTYRICGMVSDADNEVEDMLIVFSGEFSARCAVFPDGTFEFTIVLDEYTAGEVCATTMDGHGGSSNSVTVPIGPV